MLVAALLCSFVTAQALNEPTKIHFGAWLDTADTSPGANNGDRPLLFNQRMGFNASFFQYAQNIPIDTYPFPAEQIDATETDALVHLTVYPRPSPWSITDADINVLTSQMAEINRRGRKVVLRFAPEMNGNWNYWGQKPTQFVALWRRVFNALRRDAPQTAMVWAPSSGNGYPYGRVTASAEDLILLDTNNDGVVNSRDDPYSPYYPGDEYVDWVGASIYFYGPTYPWQDNVEAPPGTFDRILNDGNFYQQYAVVKNKPYMLAETAASFHTNTPTGPGVGDLAVKRAFWRQYITNATFLQTHPQLKMISLFEFFKAEEKLTNGEDDLRDFRVSNVTSIREAFLEDFAGVAKYYLTANYAKPGEVITTSPNGSVFPNLRTPVVVVDDKLPTGNNNQAIKTSSATTIGSFFSGILSLLFLV